MIIAYGEVKDAEWTLDAQGNFRTLVIINESKEEKLQFELDEISVYLYCKDGKYEIGNKLLFSILSEILTFMADTDEIEDAVNEIMIALL